MPTSADAARFCDEDQCARNMSELTVLLDDAVRELGFDHVTLSGRELPWESRCAALWVGVFAFEAARRLVGLSEFMGPRPQLTPRQHDCVVLAGRSKKRLGHGPDSGSFQGRRAELLRSAGLDRAFVLLRGRHGLRELLGSRLERAIGVLYLPEKELAAHYFDAAPAD